MNFDEREELVVMPPDPAAAASAETVRYDDEHPHSSDAAGGDPTAASASAVSSPMSSFAFIILFLLVIQNTAAIRLTHFVESASARPFSTSLAVAATEFIKGALCFLILAHRKIRAAAPTASSSSSSSSSSKGAESWLSTFSDGCVDAALSVLQSPGVMFPPALIFAVENNLFFVAAGNVAPALFVVLYQSKLLLTALVWSLCRHWFPSTALSNRKWSALAVVFLGIVIADIHRHSKPSGATGGSAAESTTLIGILAVLACAALSAVASVYFEAVVKSSHHRHHSDNNNNNNNSNNSGGVSPRAAAVVEERQLSESGEDVMSSLLKRNVQLAAFSFLLNVVYSLFAGHGSGSTSDSSSSGSSHVNGTKVTTTGSARGMSFPVVFLIFLNALGGLLVSVAIVYSTSVAKTLALSTGIVLQAVITVVFGGSAPTFMFVVGAAAVLAGTIVFATSK